MRIAPVPPPGDARDGRRRPLSRRALLRGAGALTALSAAPALAGPPTLDGPVQIEVRARAIDSFSLAEPGRRRFGALTFRGGLALTSTHPAFGGLSGVAMEGGGTGLLAVTDVGSWLKARLVLREGRPAAIEEASLAPMLNAEGRALKRTRAFDTEALALGPDGAAYVALERVNEVLRFDLRREGLAGRGRPVPVPPAFKRLAHNLGPEALGLAPARSGLSGALVAIAERSGESKDTTPGFILSGPRRGAFQLRLTDEFEVTDLAFLPGGDMLVLERRRSSLLRIGARLRRIKEGDIRSGALLEGPVLMQADLGQEIDNMEALSVHRDPGGETVLTLLSDDNFSGLQRSLLLQFTLEA